MVLRRFAAFPHAQRVAFFQALYAAGESILWAQTKSMLHLSPVRTKKYGPIFGILQPTADFFCSRYTTKDHLSPHLAIIAVGKTREEKYCRNNIRPRFLCGKVVKLLFSAGSQNRRRGQPDGNEIQTQFALHVKGQEDQLWEHAAP